MQVRPAAAPELPQPLGADPAGWQAGWAMACLPGQSADSKSEPETGQPNLYGHSFRV